MSQSTRLCRTYLIEIIKKGYHLIGPFIDRKTAQVYAPLHREAFSNDNVIGHLTPVCLASPLYVSLTAPYSDSKPIRCSETTTDTRIYIFSVKDGQIALVGPFDTREEAYWWKSAYEVSSVSDDNWMILDLKNPHKISKIVPELALYHRAIADSLNVRHIK